LIAICVDTLTGMPILFLDVDGPLIPFGGSGYPAADPSAGGHPLLPRLDPGHGPRLLALGAELVWATTWQEEANEVIAPRLGLPSLPVVTWPGDEPDPAPGVHWKTAGLVRWAAGRAFAWLDDEISEADRRWVAARHQGRALVHRVDPRTGLTVADFAVVARWVAGRVCESRASG
jgi:hypothetical protein